MNRWTLLVVSVTACLALALRLAELNQRPMHNDEAVNALKFQSLWEHGTYRYDPNEHHGPTLGYATLVLSRLRGLPAFAQFSETDLRLVPVVFGVGLIFLLLLTVDGLGRTASAWAGLFTAVSPAMVYYSIDYIHESLLVFFTFLVIAAGWRYAQSQKIGWALLTGLGLGLMDATKETFIIAVAAMCVALLFAKAWARWVVAAEKSHSPFQFRWIHFSTGLAAWLLVALVLFSSFFTNVGGLLDSLRAYLPWLNRAGGASPHIHPWYFYFKRVLFFHVKQGPIWTEALILILAIVGFYAALARKWLGKANATFLRFIAIYTLALTVAYCVIPYKTPWCLLGFWQGMILLAGVGATALLEIARGRMVKAAVGVLLMLGTAHLAWQAWQANGKFCADPRNPYVYAQTSPDIMNLVKRVEAIALTQPEGQQILITVVAADSDYWPLPWYLRGFNHVGWWDHLPVDQSAPVVIASPNFEAEMDKEKDRAMTGIYELRPQTFLELYVETNLWQAYLKSTGRKTD